MTDDNGNSSTILTLSQRLVAIRDTFEKNIQDKKLQKEYLPEDLNFPRSSTEFCIICGAIRLDSDPTGLTCGNKKCLAELRHEITDLENRESELKEVLSEIASLLMIDVKSFDENVLGLANAVKTAIEELSNIIKELWQYII